MHKHVEPRSQTRIMTLDDVLDDDSIARVIDTVVDFLIDAMKIEIPTGKSYIGRPAYSAVSLAKLYIYGYIHGITSTRGLEKAARNNLEVIWLLSNQRPHNKTISEFRKNNGEFIKQLFYGMSILLASEQLITNELWAIDGHKVKAYASRDMYSSTSLKKSLQELAAKIEKYQQALANLGTNDKDSEDSQQDKVFCKEPTNADSCQSVNEQSNKLSQKIEKCEKKLALHKELLAQLKEKGGNYISASDMDSLLLKMRRGKCAGYNVQYVVDSKHHFVVGLIIVDSNNDKNALYEVIKQVSEETGVKPKAVVADKGYVNYRLIRLVSDEITPEVYVIPEGEPKGSLHNKFVYDDELGVVYCPQGKAMRRRGAKIAKGVKYEVFIISGCGDCPIKQICVKDYKSKTYLLSENHYFIIEHKKKMELAESKMITDKRKEIIEHVFGTIDHMAHYNGFKLRGTKNALTESYLYAMAYNFKRLFTLLKNKKTPGFLAELCPHFLSFLIYTYIYAIFSSISDNELDLRLKNPVLLKYDESAAA